MHTVVVLAFDGVVPFEVSVPIQVFGRARLDDGRPAYRVLIAATAEEVSAGPVRLRAPRAIDALAEADTVVVPGVADASLPVPDDVVDAVRSAGARGARVAAISGGAFVLAAAGLLDGHRATTQRSAAADLARRHPAVLVEPDVLYVDEERVLTCSGAGAGLDMCLHLVRRDFGAAVAAGAARSSVMPLERHGGQAPVAVHEPPEIDGPSLQPLLVWLEENCSRDLGLDDIAARAGVSSRTLSRRFREQIGTSPVQWLNQIRLRRAQALLEETALPVEHIARQVGFSSPTTFRERFRQGVGVSPQAHRRAFRTVDHPRTPRRAAPAPGPGAGPLRAVGARERRTAPPPGRALDREPGHPGWGPARSVDLGGLQRRVDDLVESMIAAAETSLGDGVPQEVRDVFCRQLRAVTTRMTPVILESMASGRTMSDADLAVFREAGAESAHDGVPLLLSLRGIGPALAAFARFVISEAAQVPVASHPVLLARAAHTSHRISVEVTAGWFGARTRAGAAADRSASPGTTAEDLDAVDRTMLTLVIDGKSNKHIARATAYSPQTVRWRLSRLMRRWGVSNRAALAATAVQRGVAAAAAPQRAGGRSPGAPLPRPGPG